MSRKTGSTRQPRSGPAAASAPAPNPAPPQDDDALFRLCCTQSLEHVATQSRSRRSAEGGAQGFDAQAFASSGLLSVHFTDGSVLHTNPVAWADRFGIEPAPDTATDTAAGGRVLLPFEPAVGAAATRGGGGGQLQVERFELSRLTPPTALDRLYDFGALFSGRLERWFGRGPSQAAAALAGKLCWAYENAALHDSLREAGQTASGRLLRFQPSAKDRWQPLQGALTQAGASVVLLLHGTASSTRGSFQGLWQDEAGKDQLAADWTQRLLRAQGPDAPLVLAFEHRSLTASPLHNALDLAEQLRGLGLPQGTSLRLLSHSRGGLVGDLLCLMLGQRGETDAERDRRNEVVERTLRQAWPTTHPDHALLADFAQERQALQDAGWTVEEFVRVACPARGTLLADRRTDLFLSLLLRAVELGFGIASPWYARLASLVQGLVAARADASQLPGLEAMIPGKPLTLALNALPPELRAPGRLRVIAGDAQAKGWGGLLTVLGDLFYGLHDHDFVVHTHAMFGGPARADALSLRVEDPSVSHFGYFKPRSLTRQAVLAALDGERAGFNDLALDESRTRGLLQLLSNERSRRSLDESKKSIRASGQARPLLVLLPGIMGSELSHKSEEEDLLVWLSLPSLLGGHLKQLDAGVELQPTGVMSVAYERLLKAAESQFHVVAYPFDWRRPIDESGHALATELGALLDLAQQMSPPQPVHVLAHSMGGLVARAALKPGSTDSALWQRFEQAGGRLLMLGTPNRGSYAPAQLLLRQHDAVNLVALAAANADAHDLARLGARFPGLLAMLPHEPDPQFGDLFLFDSWQQAARKDHSLVLPDEKTLKDAAKMRKRFDDDFRRLKDCERVLYVAGQAPTPRHFKVVAGQGGAGLAGSVLRFGVTPAGDGTVPWDSCLDAKRTWYVSAAHGDLPDLVQAFDGYFELLRHGSTHRLSQEPPVSRAAPDEGALFPLPALPSLPVDVAAGVLGVSTRAGTGFDWLPPIEIRIVHGSLDYARFPLIVGHYANDGLFGAAQRVNEKLDGLLARMIDLELVTGRAETATYLRPQGPGRQPPAYPGAIVIGLGNVGELTAAALTDGVTRGVLRYAVEHLQQDGWAPREGPLLMQFSTLLVGTHVQALSRRDSMAAVLQGIWRAGQLLADGQALGGLPARVVEVELIEIEEPVALDAAYALEQLLARSEWQPRYHWHKRVLESRDGGLRGFKPGGSESLWQRLTVREDDYGGLRFELIAERARVESTQVYADVASLKDYIARLSDEGADGAAQGSEAAAIGRVLFQLLLPQPLKSRLANFERTVLVVDDETAALPWELLTPPQRGSSELEATQPLAVQAGMVRQRVTTEFRAVPQLPAGWTALVVGEPSTAGWRDRNGASTPFAALPGARAEAKAVMELLHADQRPWQVTPVEPGASFERVRTALLQQPWRVLHLAGHGVVDHWVRTLSERGQRRELQRTGMLLSHQQILSAGDVEQMDPAPEFVFINCCYSGREGAAASSSQQQQAKLASSLAMQFIRMGTKAVVAAGWRVDDAEGLAFARSFYRNLLDGQRFGDAVHGARRAIHAKARTNTWGAYQCYGDPDWRLVDGGRGGANDARQRGSGRLRGAERCMSANELAERILQAVQVAGDKPTIELVQQLQDLQAALQVDDRRKGWLQQSVVATALGWAYRELGRHDLAWHWWREATLGTGSRVELRHLELAARTLTRLDDADAWQASAALLQALAQLDQVAAQTGTPPPTDAAGVVGRLTDARATIDGSRLLRDAVRALGNPDPQPAAELLLQAAACYGRSHAAALDSGADTARRSYTLANAALLAAMAALLDPAIAAKLVEQPWLQRIDRSGTSPCDAVRGATQALIDDLSRRNEGGEFWDYTNVLELRLARCTLQLALRHDVDDDDIARLADLMKRALVRWPAPVELQSMRFSLGALLQVLDRHARQQADAKAVAALRDAVQSLLDLLAGHRVRGGEVG